MMASVTSAAGSATSTPPAQSTNGAGKIGSAGAVLGAAVMVAFAL